MGSLTYLFFAYSAIWMVVFGYGVSLWRKQDRIEKGLKYLQEQSERRSSGAYPEPE